MKAHCIYIIAILLCLTSCAHHSPEWEKLQEVESYIEARADSALAELQGIRPEALVNQGEKAKHALLLSMAMDKNYIDRTDFEVLQPAIDYYLNHGTATDKLRTFYYEGRIFTNQGDNASATICFNKALSEGGKSKDILTKARVHFMQSNIYRSLYKWDHFIEENQQAAEYFKEAGLSNSYANCLIRIINGCILKNNKAQAEKYIHLCEPMLDSMSTKRQGEFYSVSLIFHTNHGTKEKLASTLNKYLTSIPEERLDWLSIANAYSQLADYQSAHASILRHKTGRSVKEDIRYHALISQIYQKMGMPDKALEAYINYSTITDSIDLATYRQTTQFIEQRHQFELQAIEEREKSETVMFLSVIIVLVLLSVCIGIRIRLTNRTKQKVHLEIENEKYRLQCLQIEEERDNLNLLLAESHELSDTAHKILSERVSLLNKFFVSFIKYNGDTEHTLNNEIQKLLTDKETFMNSNRLSFQGSHPQFIQYLGEKGLTEWEINYCCLYALGLNGKEIGTYIKMRSHYNQSSVIREKLGISEHDTNLGIYLRKLMVELPSK